MSPALLLSLALLTQAPAANLVPHAEPADESFRLVRAPLELLGGAALGISAGFLSTLLVCAASGNQSGDDIPPCIGTFLIVTPLAAPLGTWLIGNALDGDGSLLATYGGLIGAGAVVGGMALAMGNHFDDTPGPAIASVIIVALGPMLGYELSSHTRASRVTLVPSLSPKAPGFALVGSF